MSDDGARARAWTRWLGAAGGAAAGAVVAVLLAGGGHSTRSVTRTVTQPPATRRSVVLSSGVPNGRTIDAVYRAAGPGVVEIMATTRARGSSSSPFGPGGGSSGVEGTGVVFDTRGDIVTNQHVVAGASSVRVTFDGGRQVRARVVGSDASSDVGVIHVDVPAAQLHPLRFGNPRSARVGDPVIAIGSPFGQPETVTAGIVSQVDRSITAPNGYTIPGAIQTDAAINPGNSGGPLLDARGRVLGLNEQIQSTNGSPGGQASSSGIGFAVPADSVTTVARATLAGKTIHRAYFGASLSATPGSPAEIEALTPGGPAVAAGVQVRDVVTRVDGVAVNSTNAFIAALSTHSPGQTVTLTIRRHGHERRLRVRLGTRPAQAAPPG